MVAEPPRGCWNPGIELMPRDELRALQWWRLERLISYVWRKSSFYQAKMSMNGITPGHVENWDEFFTRFPLTMRSELEDDQRSHPPLGSRLAVGAEKIFRVHSTSGSSGGEPLRAGDTEQDWIWGAGCWTSSLYNFGIRPHDRVMTAFGYGASIGFWGAHYGLDRLGCRVIPTGSLDTKTRLERLVADNVTALACTPSYALRLAYVAEEMGLDLAKGSSVERLICGGEVGASLPATRERLAEFYGAVVGDFSGTTETAGVIAFSCSEGSHGLHLNEDRFIVEVLDYETLQPVSYENEGVLVVTPLVKEAMPLLRYVTNDRVVRVPGFACSCGRTFDVLRGGILGRYDDLYKLRGVLFSPEMLEQVVRSHPVIEEFDASIQVVDGLDTLILKLEPTLRVDDHLAQKTSATIRSEIKHVAGFNPSVELVPHGSLPRFEGKGRRFRDNRESL